MDNETMSNQDSVKGEQDVRQVTPDTEARVETDTYDRGIVPAETAARIEREGTAYKNTPEAEGDSESIRTTDGYTVDREGLLNNYAIEPEMYYEVPGDATAIAEAEAAERADVYEDISEESDGKLTEEHDDRGRGPGVI